MNHKLSKELWTLSDELDELWEENTLLCTRQGKVRKYRRLFAVPLSYGFFICQDFVSSGCLESTHKRTLFTNSAFFIIFVFLVPRGSCTRLLGNKKRGMNNTEHKGKTIHACMHYVTEHKSGAEQINSAC